MNYREPMPRDREGRTVKLEVDSHEGYVIANIDDDGNFRELFLQGFGKEGSSTYGWTQAFAMLFSIGLQTGGQAFLDGVTHKLGEMKFDPQGKTNDPDVPEYRSVPDYIVKKIDRWFGGSTG